MWRVVLVLAIATGLVPTKAVAAEGWTAKCKSISSLAETIMKGRQAGVAMSDMMEVDVDPGLKDLTTRIVMAAYEKPHYSTEKIQQETIADFRDEWYLMCAQALKK